MIPRKPVDRSVMRRAVFRRWAAQVRAGLSWAQWLSFLTGILLFALINLVVTLVLPSTPAPAPVTPAPPGLHVHEAPNPWFSRPSLWIDAVAAVLAICIAPYLVRAFDRMQQRVLRQNNELRSLHVIGQALNAQLNLTAILEVAVREATLAVDSEIGALWLFAAEGADSEEQRSFYNISAAMETMLEASFRAQDVDLVRASRAPHRRQELDETWASDRTAALLKLRNTITVPIFQADRVIGALKIANRGGSTPLAGFSDEDATLLAAIASAISVAVQNARLYAETRRRGEVLRTLVARTADAVSASSDAPRLMQILADEAVRILGCARIAAYAREPESEGGEQQYRLLAWLGGDGPDEACTGSRPPDLLTPFLFTSADRPMNTGYLQRISHGLDMDTGVAPALDAPGYLCVLHARDRRRIGVLCMIDSAARPPSQERDAFAEALAAQASVVMENTVLSEKTQSLLERTQALQVASGEMAKELNADRVLVRIIEGARHVLEADACTVWDYRPLDSSGDSPGWTPRERSDESAEEGETPALAVLERARETGAPQVGRSNVDGALSTLLALPLIAAGGAVGAMLLAYRAARSFADDELDRAQIFAQQAANALQNARLFADLRAAYARERRIAEALQRSLLPAIPERIGVFEFAHEYQAALEEAVVGGDFYDLFALEGDLVAVVMGDVSGKGLRAAVQTAMVKYTLRGFAFEMPRDPEAVLIRLNKVLCSHMGSFEGFVTLFYGVLDTATGRFCYSNAGHESPLWRAMPEREVRSIDSDRNLPLGIMDGVAYSRTDIVLGAGDLLLLFTDGLSEARNAEGDFLGVEGLQCLIPERERSAAGAVKAVYTRVRDYAEDNLHDDVALLVLRRIPG